VDTTDEEEATSIAVMVMTETLVKPEVSPHSRDEAGAKTGALETGLIPESEDHPLQVEIDQDLPWVGTLEM